MEANVIYRIAKGDEMAFDAFMDYYSSTLYHYAYGIIGNKESAEEVVSDVFFEIWKIEIVFVENFPQTVIIGKEVGRSKQKLRILIIGRD